MHSGVFTFFLEQRCFDVSLWKASIYEKKSHLDSLFPRNVSQLFIHFVYQLV